MQQSPAERLGERAAEDDLRRGISWTLRLGHHGQTAPHLVTLMRALEKTVDALLLAVLERLFKLGSLGRGV